MPRLNFDCEELLHWWEPKSDISFIFNFNWSSLHQFREAITVFMAARMHAISQRATRAITENGCPRLKSLLASNPESPADLLDYLAEVGSPAVLVRLAENASTSKETLSKLAFHENSEVRSAVADNPSSPESCFKRLANDICPDVRYRVAENPNSPVSSLYLLVKDENPFVSQRAKHTLARILGNTSAMLSRMIADTDLMNPELSVRPIKHLIDELKELCGGEIMTVEFVQKKNKSSLVG